MRIIQRKNSEEVFDIVMFLGGSGIVVLLFHSIFFQSIYYVFLPWNLFLAWIPVFTAGFFEKSMAKKRRGASSMWFFLWLIFFPNSPYILTDFIHVFNPRLFYELAGYDFYTYFSFTDRSLLQISVEFLLVALFSLLGLIFAYVSIGRIHAGLSKKILELRPWHVTLPLSLLSGIGIYIGRVMRFNSWDLILRPWQLAAELFETIFAGTSNTPVFLICLAGSGIVLMGGFHFFQRFSAGFLPKGGLQTR